MSVTANAPRIASVLLNVRDPERLAAFYVDQFGMRAARSGDEVRLGFGGPDAFLALRRSPAPRAYRHDRGDRYWKIGVTLPDVACAHAQLRARGIEVSTPEQFRDIGYLCHLTDPEGFQIELLQHSFNGAPRSAEGDPSEPLGGGATLAHITLRTADLESDLALFRDRLGMSLLSRQPVRDLGFDLYFLAFTEETPPRPELTAVENRPWLWRRPYTLLELQHRREGLVRPAAPEEIGFAGIRIEGRPGLHL